MRRNLVPPFILEQYAQGCTSGSFDAACLFVDTSGFTPLTAALMGHGTEGAESIAQVLGRIFDPLIQIVNAHGGFVAGFAGDAFKAIFPSDQQNAIVHALHAAWQIRQTMLENPIQQTRFGDFEFAVKVCMAQGEVAWAIWTNATEVYQEDLEEDGGKLDVAQSAAYSFYGQALARCFAADPYTNAGEVVLAGIALDAVVSDAVLTTAVESEGVALQRLETVLDELSIARSAKAVVHSESALLSSFYPAALLSRTLQGEFRQIVTVFVNLHELPPAPFRVDASFSQRAGEGGFTTFFELLNQYGGYLCRVGQIGDRDAGGTLLLFWGAPTSYENNVERALNFALDAAKSSAMLLRVGVTTNLAYAGFVGAAAQEEYTCHSPHVNLAARQMVGAAWGEVLLDGETARLAEEGFALTALGERQFKGFADPLPVFRLDGRRDETLGPHFCGRLVGRADELDLLQSCVEPLRCSQFGGVVTLTGEAGIGKSRLVHAFQQESLEQLTWISCQSDEILRQPLNPLRHWLRGYFGQARGANEAENKEAFEERLAVLLGRKLTMANGQRSIVNLGDELERGRSFLGALVGLRWEGSLYEQLEPELRFENTLDALKSLVLAESLAQPLILHVEDAHWLDGESRLFLERLTRNVEGFPFLVLLSTRPMVADEQVLRDVEPSVEIELAPLAGSALDALVADAISGVVAPALVDLLGERTNGNPFFVEQLLFYLQENGHLAQGDEGWSIADPVALSEGDAALPDDVRMVLTARLDRLAPDVKEVVQTASVLGREFDVAVLARMMDDSELAEKIEEAGLAAVWSAVEQAVAQARVLFRHALLRDAAYDMQLRSQLRALHGRAAQAVEAVYAAELAPQYATLVYHFHRAEEVDPERKYAGLAGEYAAGEYANEDAVRYLSRALELTGEEDVEAQFELVLARERANDVLGDRDAQRGDLALLGEIRDRSNRGEQRAKLLLRKGMFHRAVGEYAEAMATLGQAKDAASTSGNMLLESQSLHYWGRTLWQQGNYDGSQEKLSAALALAQTIGDRREEAQNLYDLGLIAYYKADYKNAMACFENALGRYREVGYRQGEVNCQLMFGGIYYSTGRYELALRTFEDGLILSRQIGWQYGESIQLGSLGTAWFDIGNYHEANKRHTQAQRLCHELQDLEGEATSYDTLGLIAFYSGALDRAVEMLERALSIQRSIGDQRGEAYTLTHLGYVLLDMSYFEDGRKCLIQAYKIRMSLGEKSSAIDSQAGLLLLALEQNDHVESIEIANEILEQMNEQGLDGIEFPVFVYLLCWKALNRGQESDDMACREDPLGILQLAYDLVQERAGRIEDDDLRNGFLQNVAYNREVVMLWERYCGSDERISL